MEKKGPSITVRPIFLNASLGLHKIISQSSYFNGKSSKDIYIKHEIATLLNNLSDSVDFSAMEYTEEIEKLKKVRPHAIITTNYDDLLEKIFDNYQPIVGHNVVTVNYTTYGEIMKFHGSSKEP